MSGAAEHHLDTRDLAATDTVERSHKWYQRVCSEIPAIRDRSEPTIGKAKRHHDRVGGGGDAIEAHENVGTSANIELGQVGTELTYQQLMLTLRGDELK